MAQETQLQVTESSLPEPESTTVESQPETQSSKLALPITILALRSSIFVCLLVALIVIASDSATFDYGSVTIPFNSYSAYRYVLSIIVLGLAYTTFQIPLAVIHLIREKPLFNNKWFLVFNFISDMVVLSLLATGVGAGFGATLDLKTQLDALDDKVPGLFLPQARKALDKFFDMASVSTAFLLLAFLCSFVTSAHSSLALSKKLNLK